VTNGVAAIAGENAHFAGDRLADRAFVRGHGRDDVPIVVCDSPFTR
jgi:hypothetical protein